MSIVRNIKSWRETRTIDGAEVEITVCEPAGAHGYITGEADELGDDMSSTLATAGIFRKEVLLHKKRMNGEKNNPDSKDKEPVSSTHTDHWGEI